MATALTTFMPQRALEQLCDSLDQYLLTRTFLEGDRLSFQDICLATQMPESVPAHCVNVSRWLDTIRHQQEYHKAAVKSQQPPQAAKPPAAKAGKPKSSAAKGADKGAAAADTEGKVTFNIDKSVNFPGWYDRILDAAELVDRSYPVKGMPVFRPYGYYMHNAIMNFIEVEWEKLNIEKGLFPTVIPEAFLNKEEEHVKGFNAECFWVEKGGLKKLEHRLALRPTSETAMYSMFGSWIQSFRDLPLKIHQTCTIFRYETKDTKPLIRVREIPWNEAHTAHASPEDALHLLEEAWLGYRTLIEGQCGVFGLRLRRPDWDRFAGAEHTDVMDHVMPCGRVLQIIGAHYLGQKFAKPFDIKFLNERNEIEYAYMTCFGISTRVMAACISMHGDEKGLVLPSLIARYQVVVVPVLIGKESHAAINALAAELVQTLRAAGIRVLLDDRDKRPAEKYYHWEMKGVPCCVQVGPRDAENRTAMVVRRDNAARETVPAADLVGYLHHTFARQLEDMRRKSLAHFQDHVTICNTLEEMEAAVRNKGGFARIPFHSMGMDGKEADQKVHELCGGEVRGFCTSDPVPPAGTKCLITGLPATRYGYVARSY